MADCGDFSIVIPELECGADISTWMETAVAQFQAAINHVISCVQSAPYPQCDICALKADLVSCPLTPEMLDFTGIAFDEIGGQGKIPYPPNLQDLVFKTGTDVMPDAKSQGDSTIQDIVFGDSFTSECHFVNCIAYSITDKTNVGGHGCSGLNVAHIYTPFVYARSKDGFSVFWASDDANCQCKVEFMWFAVGD